MRNCASSSSSSSSFLFITTFQDTQLEVCDSKDTSKEINKIHIQRNNINAVRSSGNEKNELKREKKSQ